MQHLPKPYPAFLKEANPLYIRLGTPEVCSCRNPVNPAEEWKLPGKGVERDKEESRTTRLAQHLFARRSLILLEVLLETRLAPRFKLGQLVFLVRSQHCHQL